MFACTSPYYQWRNNSGPSLNTGTTLKSAVAKGKFPTVATTTATPTASWPPTTTRRSATTPSTSPTPKTAKTSPNPKKTPKKGSSRACSSSPSFSPKKPKRSKRRKFPSKIPSTSGLTRRSPGCATPSPKLPSRKKSPRSIRTCSGWARRRWSAGIPQTASRGPSSRWRVNPWLETIRKGKHRSWGRKARLEVFLFLMFIHVGFKMLQISFLCILFISFIIFSLSRYFLLFFTVS